MAFTWASVVSEIKDRILEYASSGQLKTRSITQPDGQTVTFHSINDLYKALRYAEAMAESEDSGLPVHRPFAVRRVDL